MTTASPTIDTIDGVSELDADAWNRLVDDASPFLEYGFLATLEQTGCLEPDSGWTPRIIVARNRDGRLAGAVPFYVKHNSDGEFVFDYSWANASHRAGRPYYPKGVVAVPFTPVTGLRILVDDDRDDADDITARLLDEAIELTDELDLSSLHFNFIRPKRRHLFEERDLPIRLGYQYHWLNDDGTDANASYGDFDDYLNRFRSKKRSNIRRERRKLRERGVTTRVVRGDELTDADMRRMFRYYLDTIHKYFYGRQYLTEAFFVAIREHLADRLHLVFAEDDGEPFAGAFNLVKNRQLYGRYWGCKRDVKYAHFETCIYRPVQWCIEHGIERFEPGAGGEHKFDRGFEPTPTYSAHYLRDPLLGEAVEDFIEHERRQIRDEIARMKDNSPFKASRR